MKSGYWLATPTLADTSYRIRIEFSIADLMNGPDESEFDEFDEGGEGEKSEQDNADPYIPTLPIRTSIVITKVCYPLLTNLNSADLR
jgi:complement component 1 Q subcomponent-binding protein, mitochondrial